MSYCRKARSIAYRLLRGRTMKPCLYLLIPALFLVSCDQREVDASRLVIRNETTYEVNSDTPFTGVSLTYHENGQVEVRITFKDGNQDGLLERYFENGQLALTENYTNGNFDGLAEAYFENGTVRLTRNYTNGNLDGLRERYYANGQLAFMGNYTNGNLDGLQEEYFENGTVRLTGNYTNGNLDGLREAYFADGTVSLTENYANGELDGLREEYREDGTLSLRENYANGNHEGRQERYDENGVLVATSLEIEGLLYELQDIDKMYLDIEVNKESVYVQEKLLFTVRLFYTISGIRNPQFTELEMPDTVIQLIGSPNQYEELIEGVRFGVYEKRYVIFPQRSGPLEIPDILFRGEVTSNFVFEDEGRLATFTEGITINVDERPSSGYQAAVNADRLVTRNEIVYEINSNIPFTGISSIYYLNGQVEERTTFKDGKRDGIFEKYSENGILSSRVYYKMDGGRLMTCLLSDSVTVTNASSDCSDLN